jgi:uncharacterized protein YaiI (UPF0178 family)
MFKQTSLISESGEKYTNLQINNAAMNRQLYARYRKWLVKTRIQPRKPMHCETETTA